MNTPTILVVEDESSMQEPMHSMLQQKGLNVVKVEDAVSAEYIIAIQQPSLILLDWMLHGKSGIDLARKLKQNIKTRNIPIIMLTSNDKENNQVKRVEGGTTDYLTKPFSTRELQTRIRAILRRAMPLENEQKIETENLSLNPITHRVTANGKNLKLGPIEFRLLHFFMTHQEQVYSRIQLLDQVWGTNIFIDRRTVDVHVRRLRRVLEPTGHNKLLQTIRGAGYRFSTQD